MQTLITLQSQEGPSWVLKIVEILRAVAVRLMKCIQQKMVNSSHDIDIEQESLADAKVSARQQCVYEGL